jgi:hypothetical protein
MANIFEKWDNTIDTEGLAADVKEASQNNSEFKEVPHGDYEVAVQQMELKASSKGDPMVSIWFKIVSDGEFKGSMIFMNQVVTQGFQVHIVNEMLRMMVSEMPDAPVIEFKSYKQYANVIMDILESINGNYEYALSYKKGKKDFSTYELTEVYELE